MNPIAQILITLLSMLNPLVAIPLYLDLTRGYTGLQRLLMLSAFGLSTFSVMTLAYLVGDPFLNAIGIHEYSLKIGGGLIVLLIAVSIVTSGAGLDKPSELPLSGKEGRKKIIRSGVSPLAIPVVIGPGSIILVILYSQQAQDLKSDLLFIGLFGMTSLLVSLLFAASNLIYRLIGDIGLVILSKLMGLVLAAVAVELVLDGIRQVSQAFMVSHG